jgi:hypothetical protein
MAIRENPIPGIRPVPALLLTALLSGCGGAGSGQEHAAVPEERTREAASMQSAALPPVERPVAKPMDRGPEHPAAIQPVERPVAKPLDRSTDDETAPDRS